MPLTRCGPLAAVSAKRPIAATRQIWPAGRCRSVQQDPLFIFDVQLGGLSVKDFSSTS
jgi:hypothetical protein